MIQYRYNPTKIEHKTKETSTLLYSEHGSNTDIITLINKNMNLEVYPKTNYMGVDYNTSAQPTTTYITNSYYILDNSSDTTAATTIGIDDITTWYVWQDPDNYKKKLRDIIKSRQAPIVLTGRRILRENSDREITAMETLRRIVGDNRYRLYLKRGFISIRAQSGKIYQIFPGSQMTNVYDNGNLIERLCVILSGNFTPVDSLIMRYILITTDEQQFVAKAIKHSVMSIGNSNISLIDNNSRSLLDIWEEVKKFKMCA